MDTNKLKGLASKATPGPWWIDSHGHHMVSESQDHQTIFLTDDRMGPATRHPETGNLSHWPNDWDASYIAAANPKVILELIAEVERLRGSLPRLVSYAEDLSTCTLTMDDGIGYFYNRVTEEELNEMDRLKAENEALRKDAERYRWLRDLPRGPSHGDLTIMLAKNRPAPNQWCTDTIRGESLDAAIDAALEGGGR